MQKDEYPGEDKASLEKQILILREALINILDLMGGKDGSEGWESPEDVWGIARDALAATAPRAYDIKGYSDLINHMASVVRLKNKE